MYPATLEQRKRRHCAFWNAELCDRPLVMIHRPKQTENTGEDLYLDALRTKDLHRYGSDPDILFRRAKQNIRRTQYLGDTLPILSPPFGPLTLSAILGARVEIAPTTTWYHSTFTDLDELKDIAFDPSNQWWKIVEECARRVANEPGAIPASWTLGSLGDNLAGLVGAEQLIFDMMERPDLVKAVLRRLLDIVKEVYTRLLAIAQSTGQGTANWLGLWSPKKTGILENDFSIMLSTEMYQEFFAEEFREMSAFFDYRLFHVDGTRTQQHIAPFLIKIPGLHGCQLGSDPGTRAMKILPTIKTLQAHGKRVFTYVFPDEIEDLFEQISPDGTCIVTVASTDDEAERIIERLTAVCARRRS